MGQQTPSMYACVFCQFLSLPMLAVAVATLIVYNKVFKAEPQVWRCGESVAEVSMVGQRAPPFFPL